MRAITAKRNRAERDGGKNQVRQRRAQCARLARAQRVQDHEARRHGHVVLDGDAPRNGRPSELHREEQDQQQRPPEDRHRVAGQRDTHDRVVGDGIALERREHARGHADQRRQQHRAQRELDGRREQRRELLQHRLVRSERRAQVAAQDVADVVAILHRQRAVEPELVQQARAPRRIHPPLAGKVLDRVAGDEVDQRERQQRHADERGNDQRDAAQQEAQHLRQ